MPEWKDKPNLPGWWLLNGHPCPLCLMVYEAENGVWYAGFSKLDAFPVNDRWYGPIEPPAPPPPSRPSLLDNEETVGRLRRFAKSMEENNSRWSWRILFDLADDIEDYQKAKGGDA